MTTSGISSSEIQLKKEKKGKKGGKEEGKENLSLINCQEEKEI